MLAGRDVEMEIWDVNIVCSLVESLNLGLQELLLVEWKMGKLRAELRTGFEYEGLLILEAVAWFLH